MAFQGDSIFWVDTEKVVPNPFQPRREFDQNKLQELSESIRMYGVLQPLTVTRTEVQRDDGTFYTEYELIAGERRLRASRLASVAQVPVIIREGEQNEQEKLELAIIENLQREDLNAIDRALAFQQLAEQFELSHTQVAQKVGRSREYVSNSIRLLALPEHIRLALQRGDLGEGHARTLLMLTDRPQEQETIFREILLKKMSVREVERIVRKIATDKVRKKQHSDIGDHLIEIEKEFTETLGTRVQIQKTEFGGKLTIDYFSEDDLSSILKRMQVETAGNPAAAAAMATMVAATPLVGVADQVAPPQPHQQAPSMLPVPEPAANTSQPDWQSEPIQPAEPADRPAMTHAHAPAPAESSASPAPTYSQAENQPQPEPERDPVLDQAPEATIQPQTDGYQPQTITDRQPVAEPEVAVDVPDSPLESVQLESVPSQPAADQTPTSPPVASNPAPATNNEQSVAPAPSPHESERRFFHNAFGFSRPAPATQSDQVVPTAPEQPTPPLQPEIAPNQVSDESPVEQPDANATQAANDESEDMYSVRNFSI